MNKGFTAIGHLTPFLDEGRDVPFFKAHADKMRDAIDTVRQYREAVGDEVDLCIEIHRKLTPSEAVVLARGIEPYHPFFYEDPTLPDNLDAMGQIAGKIHIPIATGERIHTIYEFEMLLKREAVHFVRPDVCMCGGLTHAKKIAALAEAHYVQVVPHNPLSPVSTAACVQLAACIVRRGHPRHRREAAGGHRAGLSRDDGKREAQRLQAGRRRELPPRPMNRLLKAVLDAQVIGQPYMVFHNHITGGGSIMSGTLWRHHKRRGGYLVEMGVHYGDMLMYLLGDIDEVYAKTAIFEAHRETKATSEFYEHRLKDEPTSMEADAEETAMATLTLANGAFGQFTLSMAAHGGGFFKRQIFGAKGSIEAPSDRSGNPIRLRLDEGDELVGDAILDLVPDFRLDPINQGLFGFERAGSYEVPYDTTDQRLLAHEYEDFAQAIRDDREPEVDGQGGLKATAFAYALCESGSSGSRSSSAR